MQEGSPKFEIGFMPNEDEQRKARIEAIRYELMQIERQVMALKIHRQENSETEIARLHQRQSELLAELQQLENKQ